MFLKKHPGFRSPAARHSSRLSRKTFDVVVVTVVRAYRLLELERDADFFATGFDTPFDRVTTFFEEDRPIAGSANGSFGKRSPTAANNAPVLAYANAWSTSSANKSPSAYNSSNAMRFTIKYTLAPRFAVFLSAVASTCTAAAAPNCATTFAVNWLKMLIGSLTSGIANAHMDSAWSFNAWRAETMTAKRMYIYVCVWRVGEHARRRMRRTACANAFNAFVANGHLDGGRVVWVRLTNRDQACVSLIQSATGERWMARDGGDTVTRIDRILGCIWRVYGVEYVQGERWMTCDGVEGG